MITLTRTLLTTSLLVTSCPLLAGCSGISAGDSIRETELSIVATEPTSSFSKTAQEGIELFHLTPDQLGDPEGLESNEEVTHAPSHAIRSALLSEAWYLRGQNDVDVPLSVSLERFLRAAHLAYDGIFGESGCGESGSDLCKDLISSYNRSVREIARLTNNGTQPPPASGSRYVVDLQGDNDALTLTEWVLTFDDGQSAQGSEPLGAAATACQEITGQSQGERQTVRQCVPISVLVTFDERAHDDRAHAHLIAFNTAIEKETELHGRAVSLPSYEISAWMQLFTPSGGPEALSCFGDAHPNLPTVIFLTPTTQQSYEWPIIASALSSDTVLRDHYNFCVLSGNVSGSAPIPQQAIIGSLATLLPNLALPAQVVFISQGGERDATVKSIKQHLKDIGDGSGTSLSVAGTLAFPNPPAASSNTVPVPVSSANELSRTGTVALRDSKRLLSRLADKEEGVFGGITRSDSSHAPEGTLSPMM
jgi:hypothetical protein